MRHSRSITTAVIVVAMLILGACKTDPKPKAKTTGSTKTTKTRAGSVKAASGPYDKPGFVTQVDEGRLWVYKKGEATAKSDKHFTLIGAGPRGMTVKALEKETALAYVATKVGFEVEIEDGRIWVFRAGQPHEKSDKHSTLIGAGPRGMTVKALDMDTARAYVNTPPRRQPASAIPTAPQQALLTNSKAANGTLKEKHQPIAAVTPPVRPEIKESGTAQKTVHKAGFITQIEDGRLWVFRTGQSTTKSDKHITLIGAGPGGMTIKALEKETALAYVAAKAGFEVEIEDGRIWVFPAGQAMEKSDKHATLIGAGPRGMTVKALDKQIALKYVASAPGFVVDIDDGRIWVFRIDEPQVKSDKHVTIIGAGPRRMTVKANDRATLMAYLRKMRS